LLECHFREQRNIFGTDFLARVMEMRKMKKENPDAKSMTLLTDEVIVAQVRKNKNVILIVDIKENMFIPIVSICNKRKDYLQYKQHFNFPPIKKFPLFYNIINNTGLPYNGPIEIITVPTYYSMKTDKRDNSTRCSTLTKKEYFPSVLKSMKSMDVKATMPDLNYVGMSY